MAVRQWKIISWNIWGINSEKKWNSLRDRVSESNCDVICLQETKQSMFDSAFIRIICPACFDWFEFLPSNGASGGSIIIWKSAMFSGNLIFQNEYVLSVLFSSKHNNATWVLTNVYAPCTPSEKRDFIRWFKNVSMPVDVDWIVVGDFNLYRNLEDRNRLGVDFAEMLLFKEAVSKLGLVELPLRGQRFTWTNKQNPPLLEHLDWFFTSVSWTTVYPNSLITTLAMETSDHVPCLVTISIDIPKGHIFRFENFWLQHEDFLT